MHVFMQSPVHAPWQDVAVPVMVSAASAFTYVISPASKSDGISSPCSTFLRSPYSSMCRSKSTVFCPCSASTVPPDTGAVLKS